MKKTIIKKYNDLKDKYNEISYVLTDALDTINLLEKENYYLDQFVAFKGLGGEYQYFKENAQEANDPDNPFPPLVL